MILNFRDRSGWGGPLIRKAAWALEAGGHHGDRVEVSGRALREEGGGTEESWPTEDLRVPRIFHKRGLAPGLRRGKRQKYQKCHQTPRVYGQGRRESRRFGEE